MSGSDSASPSGSGGGAGLGGDAGGDAGSGGAGSSNQKGSLIDDYADTSTEMPDYFGGDD